MCRPGRHLNKPAMVHRVSAAIVRSVDVDVGVAGEAARGKRAGVLMADLPIAITLTGLRTAPRTAEC